MPLAEKCEQLRCSGLLRLLTSKLEVRKSIPFWKTLFKKGKGMSRDVIMLSLIAKVMAYSMSRMSRPARPQYYVVVALVRGLNLS
jgi:hypothetical protein